MFKKKGYSAVQLFFIWICAWDASWNTRSFKIKDKAFFHHFCFIICNSWSHCSLLKASNPLNYGVCFQPAKMEIRDRISASVNVNGSCIPKYLGSLKQMYAYESALQGFLCLYHLKVSLVWTIVNSLSLSYSPNTFFPPPSSPPLLKPKPQLLYLETLGFQFSR